MYRKTKSGMIQRVSDGALIPKDNNNRDYREVKKWLDAGNELLPEVGPSIQEQKDAIDQQRDIDLNAGIMFEGHLMYSDETFRADLTDMIMGYDKNLISGNQNIRTKTGNIVSLDYDKILTLKLMIGQRRQQILAASWAAKDALGNS